jgi:hypothetical protein
MNAGPALARTLRGRPSVATAPAGAAGTTPRPHGEPPGASTSGMQEPTG